MARILTLALLSAVCALADSGVSGRVLDAHGRVVPGAAVRLANASGFRLSTSSDGEGRYRFNSVPDGEYEIRAEAPSLASESVKLSLASQLAVRDIVLAHLPQHQSIVIRPDTTEPQVEHRNSELYQRTLFSRDDQVFQTLNAGIDAGQHEGGGKSLEIRRFGFNLDHGGVNGGLKVLIDGVQQNQGTQGHGQGYLGSLKALSPELIRDVTITNGPFSPEYGDFSGLGVVHIRQRESMPDQLTLRLQGGNFGNRRGFFAYSPELRNADGYIAYEGAWTDGPFMNPGRYRRDNVNANFTKNLSASEKLGVRLLFGRNNFFSSGQLPLDLVSDGSLDRFGYIDPTTGGKVKLGTVSVYYSKVLSNGDTFRADGFVSRSLFDLYSNFTFFLNDPVNGDAFQQHDSRLQEGFNAQYMHTHRLGSRLAVLTAGGNFHDNQINVGLYPREGRVPTGVSTRANAHVTNGAGYVRESVSFFGNRLLLNGGLRFDEFRYRMDDRVMPEQSGIQSAGRWQGKASIAYTPAHRVPLTFHVNYGRGINSIDARGVVQMPQNPRLATTDFYQVGTSSHFGRFSFTTDAFLIDHSNEQVYIPDDGSFELKGPTRATGYEARTSIALTKYVSLNAGLTKTFNAFYKGGDHRVYVDSAPHFVANASLTVAAWKGWSGSLRMRAINHYRLDGDDPSVAAAGHTVFDFAVARRLTRGMDLNFSLDNMLNRDYYEMQNYFESRSAPLAPVIARIHGTPGYPLTAVVGLSWRFRGK